MKLWLSQENRKNFLRKVRDRPPYLIGTRGHAGHGHGGHVHLSHGAAAAIHGHHTVGCGVPLVGELLLGEGAGKKVCSHPRVLLVTPDVHTQTTTILSYVAVLQQRT